MKNLVNTKYIITAVISVIVVNYVWELVQLFQHPAHPELNLNVIEKANKYGYHCEIHNVITEDGYILEIHRLPHQLNGTATGRPPILLFSGLWVSSLSWLDLNGKNSLAFYLADRGFDVWLGNYRGTKVSTKHVHLDSTEDEQYWDYSFHELGIYDLSAIIDHILNTTSQEQIYYVGHSQSGANFLILASERPEYNNKVRKSILLSPAGYMGNVQSPLVKFLANNLEIVESVLKMVTGSTSIMHTEVSKIIGRIFCRDGIFTQQLCISVLFEVNGYSYETLNTTLIPMITTSTPTGSSIKQFIHCLQAIRSDKIRRYDYSPEHNLKKYGTIEPPEYNFTKVTTPISLFIGEKDAIITEKDVRKLATDLPNVVNVEIVPKLNHMGFFYAIDVENILYKRLVELLEQY